MHSLALWVCCLFFALNLAKGGGEARDFTNEFVGRKEQLGKYVAEEADITLDTLPYKLKVGAVSEEAARELVKDSLRQLTRDSVPDFKLIVYIRLMDQTSAFDDIIMEKVRKLNLWVVRDERRITYWSENHMLMFTSFAFLLQERYPEETFTEPYEAIETRMRWLLESKIEHGFLEFYSHIYFRYTLASMLNLHDLAKDAHMKQLAKQAIDVYLTEWVKVTSDAGYPLVVGGRTQADYFRIKALPDSRERVQLYGTAYQEAISLVTGKGSLVVDDKVIFYSTVALLLSDYVPSFPMSNFQSTSYFTRSVGINPSDPSFFDGLSEADKFVAGWSGGGYLHASFVEGFKRTLDTFNLWDHNTFDQYAQFKKVPTGVLKLVSSILSSITDSSLLFVPELTVWKHKNGLLSSLQDYFPGYKGYQQLPWVAAAGDAAIFTMAGPDSKFNTSETAYDLFNSHLPKVKQEGHMLVALYNPNKDLNLLGYEENEVNLYFDPTSFDKVVTGQKYASRTDEDLRESQLHWIFGEKNKTYVGLYRHCTRSFGKDFSYSCDDEKQAWMVVMGDEEQYTSLDVFARRVVEHAEVSVTSRLRCISAGISFDGYSISNHFCSSIGSVYVAIILSLIVFFAFLYGLYASVRKLREWRNGGEEEEEIEFQRLRTESKESVDVRGRARTETSVATSTPGETRMRETTNSLEIF